jgi:hypothetical protein
VKVIVDMLQIPAGATEGDDHEPMIAESFFPAAGENVLIKSIFRDACAT